MLYFKNRSAGILLHITSLPSPYGIGDLGPAAHDFATQLFRSGQRYWQVLPLSPIEEEQAYSPYSSPSSMAGNIWMISPDLLRMKGLLTAEDLKKHQLPGTDGIDFGKMLSKKASLFRIAYRNFQATGKEKEAFEAFCQRESYWLNDFALYQALKQNFKGKPWFTWTAKHKNRDEATMASFAGKHAETITEIKWLQYVFLQQWRSLRQYCHDLNISIIGDLPIYVSHDSVDVWAHRELFSLEKDGKLRGMAGVPPDYFNENGQLWGMPVYCWDVLKNQRYAWWIQRIKKNMELVDVLRLDHFRAFDEYWDVPAKEKTAIHGKWTKAPGDEFFSVLEEKFGDLPFIAEDLGEITPSVYALRDKYELPGMKVLQFAFDHQIGKSDHIPHNFKENFIVYTGTHDNNTTVGWYSTELDEGAKRRIIDYTSMAASPKTVHKVLMKLAYASVAKTAIIPIQDILGLGAESRMNTPASVENNWSWRMKEGQFSLDHEEELKAWCELYNR